MSLRKVVAYLTLLSCVSCEYEASKNGPSNLIVAKDRLVYLETIVALEKSALDTLFTIQLDLRTGSKEIWISPKLNVGIEAKYVVYDSGYVFNLVYADLDGRRRDSSFSEITSGSTAVYSNFKRSTASGSAEASCQVFISKNLPVVVFQDLVDKTRLLRIVDIIKRSTDRSNIKIISYMNDSKNVIVWHN